MPFYVDKNDLIYYTILRYTENTVRLRVMGTSRAFATVLRRQICIEEAEGFRTFSFLFYAQKDFRSLLEPEVYFIKMKKLNQHIERRNLGSITALCLLLCILSFDLFFGLYFRLLCSGLCLFDDLLFDSLLGSTRQV